MRQKPSYSLVPMISPRPRHDGAQDRALELGRPLDRELHDRLEDDRPRLGVDLAEGAARRRLEGVVRGVDVVRRAVVDDDAQADHREADERPLSIID
jgi:hypothetical protein